MIDIVILAIAAFIGGCLLWYMGFRAGRDDARMNAGYTAVYVDGHFVTTMLFPTLSQAINSTTTGDWEFRYTICNRTGATVDISQHWERT